MCETTNQIHINCVNDYSRCCTCSILDVCIVQKKKVSGSAQPQAVIQLQAILRTSKSPAWDRQKITLN